MKVYIQVICIYCALKITTSHIFNMSQPLLGKLAVVTGAGSGIGRAVCKLLERDGARIVALDRNGIAAADTVKELGSDHSSFEMDVTSSANITDTLAAIRERYQQPPSIVVNSAGITRDQFLLKMDEADFDAVINVNLKGTFLVMRAFAQAMVDADLRPGTIVNLASIVGKTGNIGQTNYASSKAGVESMTRVASKEFGRFGIRVNAVLPGFTRSPMTDVLPDKIKAMATQACAMRRFGEPEEIAEVIAFLASERSSFVNGASIEVTGG